MLKNQYLILSILQCVGITFIPALNGQDTDNPSGSSTGDIQENIIELDEFTVTTSEDTGYYSAYTTSATRTNELVKNTPITMTVINEELMQDLSVVNDADLARTTSSVTEDPDGFSFNQIRIRGFRSLTQRYDLFWREIDRDSYNIQRMDIVKGSNSLIYGQADPGGKVNALPKKALYGETFGMIQATLGNKEYQRFEADANISVSEDFSIRVMGVDHQREFDQLYEDFHFRGATLELSYRLNKNTLFRVHLERVELEQNLQPNMFQDATGQARYAANSPTDQLSDPDDPRPSLTAYRNEFPYTADAIQYLPQGLVDDIQLQGNPDPTRDDIKALYAPWAPLDRRYTSAGPDKTNDRVGDIFTFDWTQNFTDNLKLKIAFNREDDDRNSLARNGFSASRVQGAVGEEYIDTFWQKQDGRTVYNAVKGTLLWEKEIDTGILKDSRHNILIGYDWDNLKKNPKIYDQINEGTELFDGNYYRTAIYREQLPLANGFGPDAPNIGYNGRDDLFQLRQDASSDVTTNGYWAAIQSSLFNGRLRSLIGLRYDEVDISHSYVDHVISVAPGYFTNPNFDLPEGLTPETINVEFSDNGVKYDQVSPSIGALYWVTDEWGVFANYAKSIQSPTGTDLDPFGDVIPPVYGEGWEYGIRFDLLDGKLTGQIVGFHIVKENDNIVNYDFRLGDIITYEKYGEQYPNYFFYDTRAWAGEGWKLQNNALPGKQIAGDRSRAEGVDVEFYYNPTQSLSLVFSYTYNNLDAIEINENVNPRFGRIFGQSPHKAVVHLRYNVKNGPLKGFTFGLSERYQSKSTMNSYYVGSDDKWYDVTFDPEFYTDGFIRYQTRISGKGKDRVRLVLAYNVRNLFNDRDLVNRYRSAYYQESIQHQFSATIRF